MMSEDVDDRLSALPEEIASQILSFLPTRFAVRSSILSKRWRHSWMYVTNLDFNDRNVCSVYHDSNNLTKFVDRVLESCKSSQVKLFRLHLLDMEVAKSNVSKWIDKAVRLNVCELDIQLSVCEFPLNLLTCKTLTKLRIIHECHYHSLWKGSCPVNLPCLKTLDIAVFINPFINAFKLIYGSPILEFLSLEANWLQHEEDFIFNIPTLKHLKLTLSPFEPSFSNKVVLNVPNLEYLFLRVYGCLSLVVENVSSLVEVFVSFCNIRCDHMWVKLLNGLTRVQSFTVENKPWFPFAVRMPDHIYSCSSWPIFPNMKHLEFKGSHDPALIRQFLESSPRLEHLCIDQNLEPGETGWSELKSVPACMLTSLETIKFSICKWKFWNMEFLEYMLGNAEVLKTVTIILWNFCKEEKTRVCAKLLKLPKASAYCEIHFLMQP